MASMYDRTPTHLKCSHLLLKTLRFSKEVDGVCEVLVPFGIDSKCGLNYGSWYKTNFFA
jgi:hypothetical protein